jgi:hypothetical protein
LSAGINASFVEHDLDDGVVTLGKYVVCCPDLANCAGGIPTNIGISEELKEPIDK